MIERMSNLIGGGGLEGEKFGDGQRKVGFDGETLGDVADFYVLAPSDLPGVGNEAQQGLEKNGFTGAVGTNDGQSLPRFQRKIQMVKNNLVVELDCQIGDGKNRHE